MAKIVNPADRVLSELLKAVRHVSASGVEGHVAEFGTMTGTTAQVLSVSLNYISASDGPGRQLHLFDSFEGLPEPDDADRTSPAVLSGDWGKGTHVGLTAAQLFEQCARTLDGARIRIFEGWFKDTLPLVDPGTVYALIHIDSDLYSSAWDVLDGVFSQAMVAEGAVIAFDDWNCNRASPRFGERRAWRECVEKFGVEYSDLGDYGLVSHKMIIHGYRGI